MKKGWELLTIKECCDILDSRRKPITKSKREPGAIPYYGATGLLDYVKDYIFDEPLVLLGEDGAKWGAGECSAYRIEGKSWVNNHAHALRPKRDIVNDYWLIYFLNYSNLQSYITGVTVPKLNQDKMCSITLPAPPLSEQQRIVDYLDSAFAKIDAMKANAEKSLNEAKALFQASLKEMLEPKEGWNVATIGKLGEIFGRIGFRGYTKKDLVEGPDKGAITLSPSNIQDGSMDYTNCTYISWFKYEESPEIMINNGDVLIVKTGSSYGKSAFVENLPHKATINPQSVVIKNIKINNKFFAYLIRTPWVKAKFDEFVSGTAIPTFSQAKLSQVELSYPSNDMQIDICKKLDSLKFNVNRLQSNFEKISQECDALKQAILRQIFE